MGECLDDQTVASFLGGALPVAMRERVEAHLASCTTCTDLTTWAAADMAARSRPSGAPPQIIGGLPVGSSVERYQILDVIGRGGMGEVYAAYHPDLERRIALKIVHEAGARGEGRRARLLREARAIARLSHPNVVTVYDAGTFGDRVYVAMELVDGMTAEDWLAASPRTWREIVDVFISAGRGLAAAHAAGIVHRDFKPQNIMIGRDGSVRVMDFGLARLVGEDRGRITPASAAEELRRAALPSTVTKTGARLGTPAYMAPEQFRGERADARADQFSFCVSLHEALHGVRPRLPHLDERVGAPASTSEAPTTSRHAGGPAWLRAVVRRGLSPEAHRRFSSMDDLLRALERGRTRVRRRTIMATTAIAGAAMFVAVWNLAHARRFECKPPPERLAGVWSADDGPSSRRGALHRALLASGRSEAPVIWQQVSSALDEHVAKWRAMYQETCEATRVRGDQSEAVLDLRMRCLADNLDRVRALTDALVKADARAAGQAVAAAGDLTSPAVCGDVERLRSQVPLPGDESTRRRVDGLRQQLNDLRAQRDIGYSKAALDRARGLKRDVEATRYAPLLADLLELHGLLLADLGQIAEAEQLLKKAYVAAEAGNDDATRAEVASNLIYVTGMQGRHEESNLWADVANAILERLGPGHLRARAWVLQGQGAMMITRGDFEAARGAFELSIALKTQALGANHSDNAIGFMSLGLALKGLGKLDAALAAEDRALAIWTAQGSYWAMKALNNRGEILTALGRYREADDSFQRVLQAFEKEVGPDNVDVAYPLAGLGAVKLATRASVAAVPLFERALRLRQSTKTDPSLVAEAQFGLARALWDSGGDRARARSLAQQARATYENSHDATVRRQLDDWLAGRAGARAN